MECVQIDRNSSHLGNTKVGTTYFCERRGSKLKNITSIELKYFFFGDLGIERTFKCIIKNGVYI